MSNEEEVVEKKSEELVEGGLEATPKKPKKINKFYRGLKKFFAWFFRWLYRIEVINPENEPLDKPYVVCCNHISLMDVVIIAASLKSQVRFMAKKEVFKVPLLNWFVKAMGAFPVDRAGGDVGAIKKSIEIVKNDEGCVGIFPQGTRCPGKNPRETEIKDGAGMVALRSEVGILPVAIKTKKGKLGIFSKTQFIIGKFIPFEELTSEGSHKEQYTNATNMAFDSVCNMLEGNVKALPKEESKEQTEGEND